MSNQKKRIIVLVVLLIVLFATAVSDKNISMFEYICLFINALLYLALDLTLESRVKNQSKRIERQSKMIFHFMTSGGYTKLISKIDAMPKVISATGQVYVDFEEVMRIIRGDKIVER